MPLSQLPGTSKLYDLINNGALDGSFAFSAEWSCQVVCDPLTR